MKIYKSILIIVLAVVALFSTSCSDDFLTSSSTEKRAVGEAVTEDVILSFLGSAYQILLFDSYAASNYNSVNLMSDLRSDDLYKGGSDANDQAQLYKLSLFTSSSVETLPGLWEISYRGLARCNNVLAACESAEGVDAARLEQYKAEAHFLRAYYTHILWKFWGNVPFFSEQLTAPYLARQYTADEVYNFILEDLEFACADGKLMMKTTGADLGRVSRAAALMLRARVVLYQKDQTRYPAVTQDMATIISSGEYRLVGDFDAMWTDAYEFCEESIFETNQLPEGKTWGDSWQGYGTNYPAYVSPNDLKDPSGVFKGGWGFGPVRRAAYEMYEAGDLRRDASINVWPAGSYAPRFQDTGIFQRKYAARTGYNPPPGDVDLNYCNNLRIFRYAEALLNYAELVGMHGQAEAQGVSAQSCLDQVRRRAFGIDKSIPATAANIKLERRREFFGEGMRFWDLVRWGDAVTALTETNSAYDATRTFEEWKKYLPIPQPELDKTKGTDFELKQNGQWN
jgi:hypothetical protein